MQAENELLSPAVPLKDDVERAVRELLVINSFQWGFFLILYGKEVAQGKKIYGSLAESLKKKD